MTSTSDQKEMEKSLTESEHNTSEVTFKVGVMETYDRGEKATTKSTKIPRNSARMELFYLTDSTIDHPDTLQTQKTHDPNLFVTDTEYTEYSEPLQTLCWLDKKDLKGTKYAPAPEPTTSKYEHPIEECRGSFVTVMNPESGRPLNNPVSLVPSHLLPDLESRMTKLTKTRSKIACSKKLARGVPYFYSLLQCITQWIKQCIKQLIKASKLPHRLQLIRQAIPERSGSPFSLEYFCWYPTTLTVFILRNAACQKPVMVMQFLFLI